MPFGAELRAEAGTRFRLWAPAHDVVHVELDGKTRIEMRSDGSGWHEVTSPLGRAGTRYRFILSDGQAIPDPASRFQPDDVDGPSEVIDPHAYEWQDEHWRARPWPSAVVYELHVGSFTEAGTFNAAAAKLEHLAALGITAVSLMPVADFPGRRNWGYDGVMPFAPDSSYGRPEDLKALVDAAHAHRVAVLLDVVYNHFGPHGNYLPACSKQVFTERHHTPWGNAVNFDGTGNRAQRELVIHNALYWLEEFHLDGLRLDAVHAIIDESREHVLVELARRVREATRGREIHLVLENEDNAAHLIARDRDGRVKHFDAQWNDDVHHVLHVAATGEAAGYYADYSADSRKLGRALAEGFAYQGEPMASRGAPRGEPSADVPPTAFIAFLQNHDQIGNRAFGERLGELAAPEALRALSAVHLLLPQIPMLFMGEEWGARQPFPFFCDLPGPLGDAVRSGRREEFAKFPEFSDPAHRERIPDPQAAATFESSKLVWTDCEDRPHAEHLERYRRLLEVRRRHAPLLASMTRAGVYEVIADGAVAVEWRSGDTVLLLSANLSAQAARFPSPRGREIWREGDVAADGRHGPWSMRWAVVTDG